VFNYLGDLVIYSPTVTEHKEHLREVLSRLRAAGFTLNKDKIVLGASEIKYLGHYLSAREIQVDTAYKEHIEGRQHGEKSEDMGSAKFEEIRKLKIVINDLKGRVNTLEIEQKQSAKINQLELKNEEHKVKKLINQETISWRSGPARARARLPVGWSSL
jgi:hypothetical protein